MYKNIINKIKSIYIRNKIRINNHSPFVYYVRWFIAPKILDFPPINIDSDSELEIHALVSKSDFIALLWSLYSFYIHTSKNVCLAVHDDGSLKEWHRNCLCKLFPGSRFISRQESDLEMNILLGELPNCKLFRNKHPLNLKVFDFFEFSSKPHIVFFDADIIFYDSPDELLEQSDNSFIEDIWTNYIMPLEKVHRKFTIKVPPKINIGFGRISKKSYDTSFLESIVSKPEIKNAPYLFDQTAIALMASNEGVKTMSGSYKMTLKSGIEGYTLKHYTRVMRGKLYTEGILCTYQKLLMNN